MLHASKSQKTATDIMSAKERYLARKAEAAAAKEKAKGMGRDISHALIKVSEVFGLEPEDGRESRDGWKEFKKGTLLPTIIPGCSIAHASTVLRNLHLSDIVRDSG